jgi:predicted nucleic acid-binding protein
MASVDEDRIFLSVISLAELHFGVDRMPTERRQNRLERWLQSDLPIRFEKRVLPVDGSVVEAWGKIVSNCEAAGRPIGAMDGFMAATAQTHQLTLVTRNLQIFRC